MNLEIKSDIIFTDIILNFCRNICFIIWFLFYMLMMLPKLWPFQLTYLDQTRVVFTKNRINDDDDGPRTKHRILNFNLSCCRAEK